MHENADRLVEIVRFCFFNCKYKNAYSRFRRPYDRIKKKTACTRIVEMQQMKNAAEPFGEKSEIWHAKSLKKKPESDIMKEIRSGFRKLIHILKFDTWINRFEIVTGENDR